MEIQYSDFSYNPFRAILTPYSAAYRHCSVLSNHFNHANDLSKPNLSLFGRIKHFSLFLLECFPLFGVIVLIVDRHLNDCGKNPVTDLRVRKVIQETPAFQGYVIPGTNRKVTSLLKRPSNFFFDALLGPNATTLPGSRELFKFTSPLLTKLKIWSLWDSTQIAFSGGISGDKTYQLSGREIKDILASQTIHISPLLPKKFYLELKKAMDKDGIVILPSSDFSPTSMKGSISSSVDAFLNKVEKNPQGYGFVDNGIMLTFAQVRSLTLYQLGAMIVKSEKYYCFVDPNYRIEERQPGQEDAILLLNACGIRGFHKTTHIPGNHNHEIDRKIMRSTFETALRSAGKDAHIVFPAVGMGVWGGSPEVYWRAFLDAVVTQGSDARHIYINPGHQKIPNGFFPGSQGEEFASILNEYRSKFPSNANLEKIVNLYHRKTDLLLFAKQLKKALPNETVALFNASDPDVTLGNHVGEYVNHLNHPPTTEENYTALGTNGLCFEYLTGVRSDSSRVTQY